MHSDDLQKLIDDASSHILQGKGALAILPLSDVALRLVQVFRDRGLLNAISAVYSLVADAKHPPSLDTVRVLPVAELRHDSATAIIIAADADKETVILTALPYIP